MGIKQHRISDLLRLACQCRVATDDPKTQIGLPETQPGIIPAWGGTQQLPRLIGLRAAMEIITAGKSVDGVKAWKLGLVVAHELAEAFRERMAVAPVLKRLHEQGLKGRKGDAGFYLYKGKHEKVNPEIAALVGRPVRHEARVLMEGDIPVRLIGVMIAEAKRCIEEGVVESEDDIDTGMVFGTGFPSFRGGLVHYAHDAGLW